MIIYGFRQRVRFEMARKLQRFRICFEEFKERIVKYLQMALVSIWTLNSPGSISKASLASRHLWRNDTSNSAAKLCSNYTQLMCGPTMACSFCAWESRSANKKMTEYLCTRLFFSRLMLGKKRLNSWVDFAAKGSASKQHFFNIYSNPKFDVDFKWLRVCQESFVVFGAHRHKVESIMSSNRETKTLNFHVSRKLSLKADKLNDHLNMISLERGKK